MPHNHNMEKHSTASKEGDEDIVALATHPDPRAEHHSDGMEQQEAYDGNYRMVNYRMLAQSRKSLHRSK